MFSLPTGCSITHWETKDRISIIIQNYLKHTGVRGDTRLAEIFVYQHIFQMPDIDLIAFKNIEYSRMTLFTLVYFICCFVIENDKILGRKIVLGAMKN